jgi:ankyrin repeat protein
MAINNGMLVLASKIVHKNYDDLIGFVNKEYNTAFILCIIKQFWDFANLLLDTGFANAEQKNAYNDTTLLLTLGMGNLQLAKRIILETKVDLLQENQFGDTALDIAIGSDYEEIADLIKKKLNKII